MAAKNAGGEMPFLDHLEELRKRILIALGAVIVGVLISFYLVQAFDVINFIQAPIAPFLRTGKLAILSPTEGIMISFQLSLYGGLLIASPVLLMQLWGFLSPALYQKEKRAILPAILVGLVLFAFGVWFSWTYVVPPGIRMVMEYNKDQFDSVITFENYFNQLFVFVVALGASMELPLLMTVFAWIGVLNSKMYGRFRRFAIVINIVAGAIIAPDQSPISALAVAVPLIFLYELGVLGAVIVERRKRKKAAAAAAATAAILFFLLIGAPARLDAQVPVTTPPVTATDSGRQPPRVSRQDSARARRLGLPPGPTRTIPADDSTLKALLSRGAYNVTRFRGDSGDLNGSDSGMVLRGKVSIQRDSGIVEAEEVVYRQAECAMFTKGETQIFETGRDPAVGRNLRLEMCKDRERMVLPEALTKTNELGTDWFLRGNLAVDSLGKRLYMGDGEFTTCDLPIADYHFASGEVKWVGQSALVARPAILYVRDVPVMWLPFLFQDTKPGRRSGILVPQIGINDIVRPTRTYNRQVTNMGYYYAPSDYFDATLQADWYANRHTDVAVEARYKVRDRFVAGGLGYRHQAQSGGGSSSSIHLDHQQDFSISTSLNANLNYTTNTSIAQANTIDPFQSVQQINSSLNFTKRMAWGSMTLGGTRRQTLSDGSGQMTFPSLSISPRQISLGPNVTWSPTVSVNNSTNFKQPLTPLVVLGPDAVDTLRTTGGSRNTTMQLNTPFNLWGFNLRTSLNASDNAVTGRRVISRREPDPLSPGDSLTIVTTRLGDYSSTINWDAGIDLPQLFRGTWRLTPTVGITNMVSGPFALRSPGSGGKFVYQKKRLQSSLSMAPVFYGFLNTSIGPVYRLRHEFEPTFQLQYSPRVSGLSSEYIRALAFTGAGTVSSTAPARMLLNVGLSQNLSAKLRRPASDTLSDPTTWPKLQVFTLSTSGVSYDFEQAKEPGRTGWVTSSISNTFASGLLPGMQFSVTHDLWKGTVGTDTATFSPYLTSLQAGLSLQGSSLRSLLRLFGLAGRDSATATASPGAVPMPSAAPVPARPLGLTSRPGLGQVYGDRGPGGRTPFTATLTLTISRPRPNAPPPTVIDSLTGLPIFQPGLPTFPAQSGLGLRTSFAPTTNWSIDWITQYNFTGGRFEMQSLRLTRDLHDWRATFDLQKNPNGNFALIFSIVLIGMEQDIKFDYQQSTIRPAGVP